MSDVVTKAQTLARTCEEGLAWLAENQKPSSLDAVRKLARRARRLGQAAARPNAVAVFGASQAGKSYLVGSLASGAGDTLKVRVGTQEIDFLKELNPTGGNESTGLVSRFTVNAVAGPADTPVMLRLFSQTDVVKIIANTALEDLHYEIPVPEPEILATLLESMRPQAGTAPCDGMVSDDIDEMREYFEKYFSTKAHVQAMRNAYWPLASDIIPRLPLERRAAAFAPLWCGIERFTQLAQRLLAPLRGLNFPDVAFCDMDALLPRTTGVLNAETLFAVGRGTSGMTKVRQQGGAAMNIDRSVLAALIAEINLPLPTVPWDFLNRTDLLDFPGLRSREQITRDKEFDDKPELLGKLFLRGKVDFLFQRYNIEQEITGILMCVGPSVQEVRSLPRTIDGWIGATLGSTPEARARQRNSLFVVLTKFDEELKAKGGEDLDSDERWKIRVEASLLHFLGSGFGWPERWIPGRAFDNCFWLRSRAVECAEAFGYETGKDGIRRETPRSDADALAVLTRRRAAYLQNPLIARHVADPDRAWAAVMAPNDGGISYLAERLAPVCDGTLKAEQIDGQIAEVAEALRGHLRPFFHSSDAEAELRRAREAGAQLRRALIACAQVRLFTRLLRRLQVTTEDMAAIYWRLQAEPDEVPASPAEPGWDWADEPLVASGSVAARSTADRFSRLADAGLEDWERQLRAMSESPDMAAAFRMPPAQMQTLAGALIEAARRAKLAARIGSALREEGAYLNRNALSAQRLALILSEGINNFVTWQDFDCVAEQGRPRSEMGGKPIFAARTPVDDMPQLSDKPISFERGFQADWVSALLATIEANVLGADGSAVDQQQNVRLGHILELLGAL